MKAFNIRWPGAEAYHGTDFLGGSVEEALQAHEKFFSPIMPGKETVFANRLAVEHVGDEQFFCPACHHAPCKFATKR